MPSIIELEKGLRIEPDALDEAIIEQPMSFYAVAKELAMTISKRDGAKQDLQETEARVDLAIRKKAKASEEKITETGIKNEVMQSKDVQRAETELFELNTRVGQLSALKEAFTQRSIALRNLAELHTTDYHGSHTGEAGSRVKNSQANRFKEQQAKDKPYSSRR